MIGAWKFLISPIGLKVVAGVVLAAAVAGGTLHVYNKGKAQGKEEQKQDSAQDIKSAKDLARSNADAEVAEADARASRARAETEQSNARAEMFRNQAQAFAGQLAGIRQQIRTVPDVELHPRNVATIGLRPPGQANACYTGAEEREIAGCLEQQPVIQRRLEALEGRAAALEQTIKSQGDEIRAGNDKLAARERQLVSYDLAFTQLYNLHPPRYRSAKCLWITKCGKRTLPVPSPAELKAAKP
jgi:hypothetical protein